MTVVEINKMWSGLIRHFIHPKAGGRYWSIEVVGATVAVSHGKVGGKLTLASETFKPLNVGKANERTAESVALDKACETTRKKSLEGYREHIIIHSCQPGPVDVPGWAGEGFRCIEEEVDNTIDLDNLPSTLCFYKPHNTVEGALLKKMEEGKVLYSRKRNGSMFVLARGVGAPKLYSRRMLRSHDLEQDRYTWDDRFPHIIEAAKKLPLNTILTGELVMSSSGRDDFKMVQRITKLPTPDAIALAAREELNGALAMFYLWDIPFHDGKDLKDTTTRDRYAIMDNLVEQVDPYRRALLPNDYYTPDFFVPTSSPTEYAKENGWEGFVVVDPDGVYGEKMYNSKGKPDRPRAFCGKLKPEFEDDFIVEWDPANGIGEASQKDKYGNATRPGIKCVQMYQLNSKGEKVAISQLGVGLTEEMRINLADPKLFPQVWQVGYTDRRYISQGDDTNALDFAKFLNFRKDKSPEECINSELDKVFLSN